MRQEAKLRDTRKPLSPSPWSIRNAESTRQKSPSICSNIWCEPTPKKGKPSSTSLWGADQQQSLAFEADGSSSVSSAIPKFSTRPRSESFLGRTSKVTHRVPTNKFMNTPKTDDGTLLKSTDLLAQFYDFIEANKDADGIDDIQDAVRKTTWVFLTRWQKVKVALTILRQSLR